MGFSRLRVPEYLYQTTSGLFIFRMKVPHDCLPAIRHRELQYSLRTRCIYSARKHLASILPFVQGLYGDIKQGLYDGYPQPEVSRIIKEGIRQAIVDFPVSSRHPQVRLNDAKVFAGQPQVTPDASPFSPVKEPVAPTVPVVATASPLPAVPVPVVADVTFSDLQAAFFKEKEVTKGWRFKTEEDHRAVFNLFIEVVGNIPVKNIDKGVMREFKTTIIQLPPNMRKVARYMHKSIPEIVAMKPDKTLSAHTINKYISRLSNLFSYAVSHGYMAVNPAGGFKVKLQSRPDEEREAYSTDDLKKLFSNPETSRPSYYWSPLIALYSGCRLEEICQLHLADIRQEDGVWIFDINDKGEKNLKNLSSVRLIPIHPRLIDLGLLEYAQGLKTKGETRLFPELPRRRDGYGQTVSKWYQLYKKRCGIADGKTFHSFRHTFITHLKHKQVDPFMIHELDGHTINSETMGRYGKRYTPEILLREAIEKIDYGIGLPAFDID
jgi:integrase